jgi:hypothetical protein
LSTENERELVKEILTYAQRLGSIDFSIVVKETTGYDVIPFDLTKELDKKLISNLSNKLIASLKMIKKSGVRFTGNRINEIGRQIEPYFVRDLSTSPFVVTRLGKSGYPDTEIVFNGETIYMEFKTSGIVSESSRCRYFYYTRGGKIKKTARHLLVTTVVTPDKDRVWNVSRFIISDLSRLKVKLKPEFNASKMDLMDEKARIVEVP